VTAAKRGPDGRPLFRSRTIGIGSTPVDGTQWWSGSGSRPQAARRCRGSARPR
jgi:hypothetical protein